MDKINGVTPHALERFKERWKILKGKKIKESNALSVLSELILKSKPEPEESLILLRRERKHGGNVRYMVNGPWRFIWQSGSLVTVELRKTNMQVGLAERHKVNLIKKEEKESVKKWRRDNNIPKIRVAHYNK